MSEIYHQSVTDGHKSNVVQYYGIFPSMLKNHLSARDGLQATPIMPPVSDGWFLTKSSDLPNWESMNPAYIVSLQILLVL